MPLFSDLPDLEHMLTLVSVIFVYAFVLLLIPRKNKSNIVVL